MAELRQNTWSLDEWYAQDVAGDAGYTGAGHLYGWGYNSNVGQLGLNDRVNRSSPTQIPGSWTMGAKIAYNGGSTAIVRTDGSLWMIGSNTSGQMGNNNRTHKSSPVQLPGTWRDIGTAGGSFGGLKTDGTFWTWGSDSNGMLGLSDNFSRSSPTQLPGSNWSTIAGGEGWYLGLKGTYLYAWGENAQGQLGQNNKTQYSSPRQIPGNQWRSITGQRDVAYAIKTDGSLWAWGTGSGGRLGQNQDGEKAWSSPKQIGTDTTWNHLSNQRVTLSGYGGQIFATKTDGTLWAWGIQGDFGVLGLNQAPGGPDQNARSSPTQIGTGTDWSLTDSNQMYVDTMCASAMKNDGSLWVWGGGQYGSLGQNSITPGYRSSPTQLPGTWSSGFATGLGAFGIKAG